MRRAMWPIAMLAATAERVHARHLSERIPLSGRDFKFGTRFEVWGEGSGLSSRASLFQTRRKRSRGHQEPMPFLLPIRAPSPNAKSRQLWTMVHSIRAILREVLCRCGAIPSSKGTISRHNPPVGVPYNESRYFSHFGH
jgi:hypothetical protein